MIDMKDVLFMEISETMEMKFSSYSIIILLDLKTKAEMKKKISIQTHCSRRWRLLLFIGYIKIHKIFSNCIHKC